MNTVCFKTIGCRLNQAETAQLVAQFEASGYSVKPFGKPSDVCVIHTCTITHKAEKDCIRFARSAKKLNSNCFVILAGCAVEVNGKELLNEPEVDMVVDQSKKFKIPELLMKTDSSLSPQPSALPPILPHFSTTRAIVKVQDGCDFKCAYCIVPAARGSSQSRSFDEIIEEIKKLADNGFREITLTGANLGCYGDSLIQLMTKAEEITGIERIRLSSIELSTTEKAVIDYMSTSTKMCQYLHIPLQSGDDRILKAMGRHYNTAQYKELIEYAIDKMPLLGVGTDIITGFPSEDQASFENTFNFVKSLPFSNLHVFQYSKRPGTRAADMDDQVEEGEKKKRSRALIDTGKEKKELFAAKFLSKTVSVLVEKINNDGFAKGWTKEYLEAKVPKKNLKQNDIIEFTPTSYTDGMLQ